MSKPRSVSSLTLFGVEQSFHHKVIRCGCPSTEIESRHGRDSKGALRPCPNPRAIENLGELSARDQLIYAYHCTDWDSFQQQHPIRAWLFMKANDLRDQLDLLTYGPPIPL